MRRRRHEDYVAGMGYIGLCPGRLYRMAAGESYDLASVSGSPVVLESSAAGPLEGLTIYGWSKQDGAPSPGNSVEIVSAGGVMTTGAQMFDKAAVTEHAYINNDSGEIRTPGASSDLYACTASDYIPVTGMDYISILTVNGQNWGAFYDADKTYISGIMGYVEAISVPDNAAYIRLTVNAKYLDIFMLNAGDKVLPWEPYTGGVPAVNPYAGQIGVTVGGKNMIPYPYTDGSKVMNGVTITVNDNGTIMCDGTATANTTFNIFRGKIPLVAGCTYVRNDHVNIQLNDEQGSYASGKYTAKEGDYISLIWLWFAAGTVLDKKVYAPQFEIGEVATEYKPYQAPQSLILSTPGGLPGIPVASGGNYTDASGQKWVADYVNLKAGKRYSWIAKYTVTGNEGINQYEDTVGKNAPCFYGPTAEERDVNYQCLSNRFVFTANSDLVIKEGNVPGYAFANVNPIYNKYVYFCISYEELGTTAESTKEENVAAMKAWLAKHPTEILHVLSEPVVTDLTAAEIAAYKALYTYAGTTVVSNDAGAWMDVGYRKIHGGGYKNLIDFGRVSYQNCTRLENNDVQSNVVNQYYASMSLTYLNAVIPQNKGRTLALYVGGVPADANVSIVIHGSFGDGRAFQEMSVPAGRLCRLTIREDIISVTRLELRPYRRSIPFTDTETVLRDIKLWIEG